MNKKQKSFRKRKETGQNSHTFFRYNLNQLIDHPFIFIQKTTVLKWISTLCFFSFVFLLFYSYAENFILFTTFTQRDIFRSLGWLQGQVHWPGPTMSVGHNLPGPFFYFLLFPPLIFGKNIYIQIILWCITWLSLTYSLAFSLSSKIYKHKESLLIFLSFFISMVGFGIFQPLSYTHHPAFAILFHVLALMSLYQWRETDRNLYLYSAGLIIGLGIQIHFLVSLHIITAFSLCIFSTKKLKPFNLFCLFIFLPCLPYFTGILVNAFETSSLSIDHVNSLQSHSFTSEKWFWNIRKIFHLSYTGPLIFSVFLTFWIKWKTKQWPVTKATKNLFIITAIPILITISGAGHGHYLHFIPVFLIILFTKYCDDLMPENQNRKINYLLSYGILFALSTTLFSGKIKYHSLFNDLFFLINQSHIIVLVMLLIFLLITITGLAFRQMWKTGIFCVFISFTFQIKIIQELQPSLSPIPRTFYKTKPKPKDLKPIMEKIFLDTHWPVKTALKRIYTVGFAKETSMIAHYLFAKEGISQKRVFTYKNPDSLQPVGYMIIQHLKKFTGYSQEDWKDYLSSSSPLSEIVKEEIAKNKLRIIVSRLYGKYWLISYKTTNKSSFPQGFHNIGQSYYWKKSKWLEDCNFTQHLEKTDGFYYCMVLPGYLQKAGITIKFSKNTTSKFNLFMDIVFSGYLIGSESPYLNPDGYAMWSDLKLTLICNEKKSHFQLPDIGLDWNTWKDHKKHAKQLLAPLKFRIPLINCKKGKVREIELTFYHSHKRQPKEIKKIVWKKTKTL